MDHLISIFIKRGTAYADIIDTCKKVHCTISSMCNQVNSNQSLTYHMIISAVYLQFERGNINNFNGMDMWLLPLDSVALTAARNDDIITLDRINMYVGNIFHTFNNGIPDLICELFNKRILFDEYIKKHRPYEYVHESIFGALRIHKSYSNWITFRERNQTEISLQLKTRSKPLPLQVMVSMIIELYCYYSSDNPPILSQCDDTRLNQNCAPISILDVTANDTLDGENNFHERLYFNGRPMSINITSTICRIMKDIISNIVDLYTISNGTDENDIREVISQLSTYITYNERTELINRYRNIMNKSIIESIIMPLPLFKFKIVDKHVSSDDSIIINASSSE